jgi:hypothetical protein
MQDYEGRRFDSTDSTGIGFVAALFDFSFTQFVSEKLVKVAYVFALLLIFFGIVYSVVMSFASSFWSGIWSIIFAPVVFIVAATLIRVWLEFVVVVFRIADHVGNIAETTKKE